MKQKEVVDKKRVWLPPECKEFASYLKRQKDNAAGAVRAGKPRVRSVPVQHITQIVLVVLSVLSVTQLIGQDRQMNTSSAPLTAEQVAARMEEKGRERAQALRDFEASRIYHLDYHGFGGNKEAEMVVRMTFHSPDTKSFKVVSQEGSSFIIEHVFQKLLESEKEALDNQNRQATALTRENYNFTLSGYQQEPDGSHVYVLNVKPRSRNKFLYEGTIWVNAEDFAVTRIEAVPAKTPSFWIKKTQIEHLYIKVGDFWLPARNRTDSQIRLGGRALLTIDYNDYRINSVVSPPAADSASSALESPKSRKIAKNHRSRQFGVSDAALADALSIPR